MLQCARFFKHVLATQYQLRKSFPKSCLMAIQSAISKAEAAHDGEIRFAIEANLQPMQLIHGMTAHERALEVFSQWRVWDTEHNNGVLIYVLFADKAVEIIADRGIHLKSTADTWQRITHVMRDAFAEGRFEAGATEGITAVAEELARHFPAVFPPINELSDEVIEL